MKIPIKAFLEQVAELVFSDQLTNTRGACRVFFRSYKIIFSKSVE